MIQHNVLHSTRNGLRKKQHQHKKKGKGLEDFKTGRMNTQKQYKIKTNMKKTFKKDIEEEKGRGRPGNHQEKVKRE